MIYNVYQLPLTHPQVFHKYDNATFCPDDYDLVYSGTIDEIVNNPGELTVICEKIYDELKTDTPVDFKGHYMGVSDMIQFLEDNVSILIYCDPTGWIVIY